MFWVLRSRRGVSLPLTACSALLLVILDRNNEEDEQGEALDARQEKEVVVQGAVVDVAEVFVGRHPADPLERNDGQQTGAHERANPGEEKEEPHNCTLHGLGGCRIGKLQTCKIGRAHV